MTTILDVSRHASISKAIVLYVLNGAGRAKESTRQKVFKVIQTLDCRSNFLVRSLANHTSNSIGLVVSTFDRFYFGHLLQRASRRTESHDKQLIVTDGRDTPEREQEVVQTLAGRQCDAIILCTRYMSEKAITPLMNSIATPLLVISRDVGQARDRVIFFEQEDAAYQTVNYLISRGYSDITCITVPGHTPTSKLRLMRYREALEKNDIPQDSDKVKYNDPTMTRGYEAYRELLEEEVESSALFACNDNMTLGAPRALYQAGLRIPTDVPLFGFDDASNAKWLEPGLSTVYLPIDVMTTAAIDQAIRPTSGESVEPIPPFTGELVLCNSMTTGSCYK